MTDMKKVFLLVAIVLSSMVAVAQTNQVVWLNGRAVLGQSINQVDSLKFGEMGGDTLHLILPYAAIIHDTVIVHDTVYVYRCDSSRVPEGVEMVDLGLSVKWANMNVGATAVTGYGDYFAWGETSPKTDYSWSTYKWMAAGQSSWEYISKYTYEDGQTSASWYREESYPVLGTIMTYIGDSKTTLDKEDDAASVNWGGNWRMPTMEEIEELLSQCTSTWTHDYKGTGVAGRIFTSRKTGYTDRSIFLPAAGMYFETSISSAGEYGFYMSSSLGERGSFAFKGMDFRSDWLMLPEYGRNDGCTIRAVCP